MFRPRSSFSHSQGYRMLPFRFMRWEDDEVLLVNEVGEHIFLSEDAFADFTSHRLPESSPSFLDLKSRHFLCDSDSTVVLDLLATKYRTRKEFLRGFTGLHMFVVTLRCDHTCRYCQVSRVSEDRRAYDMTRDTVRRAVDMMFRSPSPVLKVEVQGGEPLLNMPTVRFLVEHVEERNRVEGRQIQFVVATNLSRLDESALAFFREHDVYLSTSLDGPATVHNANRPNRDRNSYEITVHNIARAREALGHDRVAALMTTTARSMQYPREIVREYVAQGFDSIFVRWISPYGFALRTGEASRYQADEFLAFYKEALDEIITLNRSGSQITEVFTQLLLRRILTPFATYYVDLESPSGAGIGAVVYNYDGNVYASDESRMLAEMGDQSFRLGNLTEHTYEEIFGGDTLRALVHGTVLETLPGCAECPFLPYCGADPVFHHATQGDVVGHRPTSGFCVRNMGIFKHLFTLLREEDPFVRDLFTSWAWEQEVRVRSS